jgi:plasmid stabilization system protein ParE
MAEYRLTQRARADLIDIYDFTEGNLAPTEPKPTMRV